MPTPSLLLIHGAATGAWVWDLWRRELAALGWQVNVLDLRGHGRSMPTDLATVTMEDYVADVASVTVQIEAAQGIHPILGGWSLGGMVAMMYAAEHPETPGLLLIDPMIPAEIGKAEMETVRRFSGSILTPETFGLYANDSRRSRKYSSTSMKTRSKSTSRAAPAPRRAESPSARPCGASRFRPAQCSVRLWWCRPIQGPTTSTPMAASQFTSRAIC